MNKAIALILNAAGGRDHVRAQVTAGKPAPQYRAPVDRKAAQKSLRQVRKVLATMRAEQEACARDGYELGVLAAEQRIATSDLENAERHLVAYLETL